jgi:hypothetical protein
MPSVDWLREGSQSLALWIVPSSITLPGVVQQRDILVEERKVDPDDIAVWQGIKNGLQARFTFVLCQPSLIGESNVSTLPFQAEGRLLIRLQVISFRNNDKYIAEVNQTNRLGREVKGWFCLRWKRVLWEDTALEGRSCCLRFDGVQ